MKRKPMTLAQKISLIVMSPVLLALLPFVVLLWIVGNAHTAIHNYFNPGYEREWYD